MAVGSGQARQVPVVSNDALAARLFEASKTVDQCYETGCAPASGARGRNRPSSAPDKPQANKPSSRAHNSSARGAWQQRGRWRERSRGARSHLFCRSDIKRPMMIAHERITRRTRRRAQRAGWTRALAKRFLCFARHGACTCAHS